MSKNALADALNKVANRTPQPGRTQTPQYVPTPSLQGIDVHSDHSPRGASQRTKSRIGKKVISGFFDPEVSKQLARLALDRDCTNEELLREALNDLFIKYHLPPIA